MNTGKPDPTTDTANPRTTEPDPVGNLRRRDRVQYRLLGLADDLLTAPDLGWRLMAPWIRVVAVTGGIIAGGLLLVAVATGLTHGARDHTRPGSLPHNILLTVTDPVHRYLDTHTQSLPLDANAAFGLWAWTGIISLIVAGLGSVGGRLTWIGWGAATTAAVWAGTEAPGREVAAAIAVLAWTAASAIALQGLSLRSIVVTNIDNRPRTATSRPAVPRPRAAVDHRPDHG
jgi:hypothetical protein